MKGNIKKMITSLETPAQYTLPIGDDLYLMNDAIGKNIQLEHTGEINCVSCGRKTKKSQRYGLCE